MTGREHARQPLVPVVRSTPEGDQNRLDLYCGHTVLRRAYMGGTYARARCPECPPKETR